MGSKKKSAEKVAEDVAKIAELVSLIKECGEVKIKLEELLDKQMSFAEIDAPLTREAVSIAVKIPRITVTYTGIEETGEQEATITVYYDKCPRIVMHFHDDKNIVYYPLCGMTVARAVELLLYEKRYGLLSKLMEKLKKMREGMKEVAEIAERLVAVSSIINA